MTATPLVVLDTCVVANFSLCDTLPRLAEPPRLFAPRWSEEIIREARRTLESKLGWPSSLTAHLEAELLALFSEAWVSGYESHGGGRGVPLEKFRKLRSRYYYGVCRRLPHGYRRTRRLRISLKVIHKSHLL